MELEMCGDFLLFLWMEDILTDAEYRRAEERFNKKMADRKIENCSEKPNNCEDFFREPTAEERKAVAEYIESISVPTGVNIFDLMGEPQSIIGESFPSYITEDRTTQMLDGWQTNPRTSTTADRKEQKK